jgi:hypothetical protein
MQWMGEHTTPTTPATQVKFFKVDAPSYDAATGKPFIPVSLLLPILI